MERLTGCEYLGGDRTPGGTYEFQGADVRHENLLALSFQDETFDLVFHGDVLEHVPDYRKALRECARVLRKGGVLVFTVPYFDIPAHIERARMNADGSILEILPAVYHGNPISEKGSLVFMQHGRPLLDDILDSGFVKAEIGFNYDPFQGFVSNNNPTPEGHMWPIVFRAWK
ncbi:MAG: class I SAM-dependent methyltransferase [Planctomycetes bacterium]|nr:class I SAM-dependent methyltransferase [Planctomycetota bacterium]